SEGFHTEQRVYKTKEAKKMKKMTTRRHIDTLVAMCAAYIIILYLYETRARCCVGLFLSCTAKNTSDSAERLVIVRRSIGNIAITHSNIAQSPIVIFSLCTDCIIPLVTDQLWTKYFSLAYLDRAHVQAQPQINRFLPNIRSAKCTRAQDDGSCKEMKDYDGSLGGSTWPGHQHCSDTALYREHTQYRYTYLCARHASNRRVCRAAAAVPATWSKAYIGYVGTEVEAAYNNRKKEAIVIDDCGAARSLSILQAKIERAALLARPSCSTAATAATKLHFVCMHYMYFIVRRSNSVYAYTLCIGASLVDLPHVCACLRETSSYTAVAAICKVDACLFLFLLFFFVTRLLRICFNVHIYSFSSVLLRRFTRRFHMYSYSRRARAAGSPRDVHEASQSLALQSTMRIHPHPRAAPPSLPRRCYTVARRYAIYELQARNVRSAMQQDHPGGYEHGIVCVRVYQHYLRVQKRVFAHTYRILAYVIPNAQIERCAKCWSVRCSMLYIILLHTQVHTCTRRERERERERERKADE
ncbi:unnamed protein product, partial [Trichogramma brassicae]